MTSGSAEGGDLSAEGGDSGRRPADSPSVAAAGIQDRRWCEESTRTRRRERERGEGEGRGEGSSHRFGCFDAAPLGEEGRREGGALQTWRTGSTPYALQTFLIASS